MLEQQLEHNELMDHLIAVSDIRQGHDRVFEEAFSSTERERVQRLQVRDQFKQYKEFKNEHKFLTKRDRLMRTAWKHGVLGIDDADSKQTSIFYKDIKGFRMVI